MELEAEKALERANFNADAVYEGDGSTAQKLEDYHDYLHCK